MSAPASDPPQDPPQAPSGSGDNKPGDASSSSSSVAGETNPPAEGGDVKMEEAAAPEPVEDTFDDIPEHTRDVSLSTTSPLRQMRNEVNADE
jgi:hypothetical protein